MRLLLIELETHLHMVDQEKAAIKNMNKKNKKKILYFIIKRYILYIKIVS